MLEPAPVLKNLLLSNCCLNFSLFKNCIYFYFSLCFAYKINFFLLIEFENCFLGKVIGFILYDFFYYYIKLRVLLLRNLNFSQNYSVV